MPILNWIGKEKIKTQKGFIQIPLLMVIIVSIIAISTVATGVVLYKQRRINLTADVSGPVVETAKSIEELDTPFMQEEPEETKFNPEPQSQSESQPQPQPKPEPTSQPQFTSEPEDEIESEATPESESESKTGVCDTNCDSLDGWYELDSSYSACVENENKYCLFQQQQYYDYSCLERSCNYTISDFRTLEGSCVYCSSNQLCREGACYQLTEIEEFYGGIMSLDSDGDCNTRLKSGELPNGVEYVASVGCYFYKDSVIKKYIQLDLIGYGYYPLDVLIKHNIKPTEPVKTRLDLLKNCEFMAQSWNAGVKHLIDITPENIYHPVFIGEGLPVPKKQELDLHSSYRKYCEMDGSAQQEYADKLDALKSKYNLPKLSETIAFLIWRWQPY